jgi:hypothetical protein
MARRVHARAIATMAGRTINARARQGTAKARAITPRDGWAGARTTVAVIATHHAVATTRAGKRLTK